MIYVLEGQVTLIEGDTETLLKPGDAATFRAGEPIGHCLENRGDAPTRCLVVGTRAAVDTITYPDHDRVCHRDRSLPDDISTDGRGELAQSPYRQRDADASRQDNIDPSSTDGSSHQAPATPTATAIGKK